MAGDPIAANADRIVRAVVGGLYKRLKPPKTRPLALLPGDVLSAEDWELWQQAELVGLVPRSGDLSPEDRAHLKYLFDDAARALTEALYSGKATLYGVPEGGLERVEILPSVLFEQAQHCPRFDWPMNRILRRGGSVVFHGVVAAGKLPRVESLRSKFERNLGGRPVSLETLAGQEARRRWKAGAHGGKDTHGALRRCSDEVAAERRTDPEATYRAAKSTTTD